jgi:positive regulator of sigma E activity
MLERDAIVVAVAEDCLELSVDDAPSCTACAGRGCGIGPLVAVLRTTPASWRIVRPSGSAYRTGDRVRLSCPGASLLWAALLVYGLPLTGLAAGAAAGAWLLPGAADLGAAAGAVAGVAVVLAALGRRLHGIASPLRVSAPAGRGN